MALFGVRPEKENELRSRMAALGVREADIVERFVKGSGKGGQKVNKTSSCVYLLHVPTGIEIKCQRERSQVINRFIARRELCDRVEAAQTGVALARQQVVEKIRRQKRRRSRRQKHRMLQDKHRHSDKKQLRQRVHTE